MSVVEALVLLCESQVCLEAGTFRQLEEAAVHPFVVLEVGEERVLEHSQDVGEGANCLVQDYHMALQERTQGRPSGWGMAP